jgi:hypothetical protein
MVEATIAKKERILNEDKERRPARGQRYRLKVEDASENGQ